MCIAALHVIMKKFCLIVCTFPEYFKTEFLAHLSRSSGWSVVITFHLSSICQHLWRTGSLKNPGPIFFELHVEPSIKGGFKICTDGHAPLTKIAAMPIYGKNT